MLSQLCRKCKGNNAGYLNEICPFFGGVWAGIVEILHLFLLTFSREAVILKTPVILSEESCMSDEKLAILRQSHTLHPHPEGVCEPVMAT